MSYRVLDRGGNMKTKQIFKEIENNPPLISLIYGDEPYIMDIIEKKIAEHSDLSFIDMNLTIFEGSDFTVDELEKVCMTYPFGCERRFVLVKEPYFLKSKKKINNSSNEKNKAEVDWDTIDDDDEKTEKTENNNPDIDIFNKIIETIPDTTCLFIMMKEIPDKRRKYLAEIRKKGKIYDVERLDKNDLLNWTKKKFDDSHKTINPYELDYFVEMTGYLEKSLKKNLYDVENLIKRLISFIGNKHHIDKEMIASIAPRNLELDIFKMTDALSLGNISHGIKIYEDMIKDGEAAMRILSTIVSQIRSAIICGMAEKNHESIEIMKKRIGSYSDYYVKMNLKRAKALGFNRLSRALERCIDAEYSIKSGRMHEKMAMELLFTTLFES